MGRPAGGGALPAAGRQLNNIAALPQMHASPHFPCVPPGARICSQVQDELGRGVPVGYMICSSEPEEVVETFLRRLLEGVSGEGWGEESRRHLP